MAMTMPSQDPRTPLASLTAADKTVIFARYESIAKGAP